MRFGRFTACLVYIIPRGNLNFDVVYIEWLRLKRLLVFEYCTKNSVGSLNRFIFL